MAKIIKTVINYDKGKWKKIYKFYSREILVFDKNIMKRKTIRKNLKFI